MKKIYHPLTGKLANITVVLKDLAGQENCDGEPYDQMMEAAEYIEKLVKVVDLAKRIRKLEKELGEE